MKDKHFGELIGASKLSTRQNSLKKVIAMHFRAGSPLLIKKQDERILTDDKLQQRKQAQVEPSILAEETSGWLEILWFLPAGAHRQ